MKIIRAAFAVAIIATLAFSVSVSAHHDTPHKVVVCKYVGTPGEDERLQTGNNPIVVDAHALEGKGFDGTFPFEFSDAQGNSIAIRYAVDSHDGDISECPGYTEPSVAPSEAPSEAPTENPTSEPSTTPSEAPSTEPSVEPSVTPSEAASAAPSVEPSSTPSVKPTPNATLPNTSAYSDPQTVTVTGDAGVLGWLILIVSMWVASEALFANERPRR